MTYLRNHNTSPYQRYRLTVGVFLAALLIFVGIRLVMPHFFPSLFTSIARPFWRTQFSIESGSLETPAALLADNETLRRELQAALVQGQSIQALEIENEELKSILGRASTTPYTLAAVLEKPPFSGYDSLIIDAGADQGFSSTSMVYAPGNVLIGRVSDVLGQTSKVALFSSHGQSYQVMIGPAHSPATAVGQGGGQYSAQLSRDVKVSEGDVVLAPSLSNAPFGIVTAVISDPAQPFEQILFAPPINIYELRWVLVDTK